MARLLSVCVPMRRYKAINTRDKYFSVLAKMIAGRFPPAYPGGPLRLSADTWDHAARPGIDLTRATLQVPPLPSC